FIMSILLIRPHGHCNDRPIRKNIGIIPSTGKHYLRGRFPCNIGSPAKCLPKDVYRGNMT
ncbi:MAG: hypothetical protein QF879_09675, partial [Candidatus Latescibacteria bacterium]|nr:hypothetical protein [Candidatus Latescibacterota bacterium]